jgi:signal transduction histidine kinase
MNDSTSRIAVRAGIALAALGAVWHVTVAVQGGGVSRALPGAALVVLGMFVGTIALAREAAASRHRLGRQQREIEALRSAVPVVVAELSLTATLQRVVDRARELLEADLGALTVMDRDGAVLQFLTSGLSEEERRSGGAPPRGHGLLGVPLNEGRALRLDDVAADPRSTELPPAHPPIGPLLAVPVPSTTFRSNLYLANRRTSRTFSAADEDSLRRFAALAAMAVEMAHLHEEMNVMAVEQERLRIAREMHDGMAQVLAYVNTKAQAVQQQVRRGRIDEADANLTQLAEAARDVYAEVRESILGLRTQADSPEEFGATVVEYLRKWEVQTGVSVHAEVSRSIAIGGRRSLELLRILQEALANVRKHAGATEVRVFLTTAEGVVRLTVSDNGRGFDPSTDERSRTGRYGLVTMRERAQGVGGGTTVTSSPGRGTIVAAEIPLDMAGARGSR